MIPDPCSDHVFSRRVNGCHGHGLRRVDVCVTVVQSGQDDENDAVHFIVPKVSKRNKDEM